MYRNTYAQIKPTAANSVPMISYWLIASLQGSSSKSDLYTGDVSPQLYFAEPVNVISYKVFGTVLSGAHFQTLSSGRSLNLSSFFFEA